VGFVLHGSESLLCELEGKWPQVNLQISWKLDPRYKLIDSLSPSSDSCPNDDTTAVNFANSATSTVVEPSIHDNAGATTASSRPIVNRSFSVMYFNCRSLLPRIDGLVALCSTNMADVFCLVETWLCMDILDTEINVQSNSTTMRISVKPGNEIVRN